VVRAVERPLATNRSTSIVPTAERIARRPSLRTSRSSSKFATFVVVGLAYAVLAQTAWWFFGAASIGSSFFPAAGVTVAALIVLPRRTWPAVLAAVFVAEFAVDLANAVPVVVSGGYAAANMLEPLIGALVVARLAGRSRPPLLRLPSRADAWAFAVGAMTVGPLVGALVGSAVKWLWVGGPWGTYVVSWWVGDGLGVLAVGAAIVVLADRSLRASLREPRRLAIVLETCVIAVIVLRVPWFTSFLVIPLLLGVAFYTGLAGVAVTGFVTAMVANVTTALGTGAFAQIEGITPQAQLIDTQLLIGAALGAAYALAIEVAERQRAEQERLLEHEARVRAESMEAIGSLSRDLVRAETVDDVIDAFLRHVDARLAPKGAGINVLGQDGRFTELRSTGVPDQVRADAQSFTIDSPIPGPEAARTGRPVFVTSREEMDRRYPALAPVVDLTRANALAAIPLARQVGPAGYLVLIWGTPRTFEPAERAYLAALGDVVGQSIDRMILREREHALAVELQHAMLGTPDDVDGVAVATAYRPADSDVEIGGDWYDAIRLSDMRTAFVVGDVVGHNLNAAKAMGRIRVAIRTLAPLFPDPCELLARLDPVIDDIGGATPTTLVYVIHDAGTNRVTFTCAGHPPPLVVHPNGGASFIDGARGIALGIVRGADRPVRETTLAEGDALVLYTDGLVERRGEPLDDGLARLQRVAATACTAEPEALRAILLRELASAEDDVAVLIVRPTEAPFRLQIDADPREIRTIRAELRRWLAGQGVDAADIDDVLLSSGEAVANAVEHAYLGRLLGDVEVRADLRSDGRPDVARLDVRVLDTGEWRRPAAEGPRGNGHRLMRALADDVQVRSTEGGTAVRLRYTVHLGANGR
jgi:integral membrane sensor domain MASE1/anti-sigma regulatory factor (Ser/Thr protein kinase)